MKRPLRPARLVPLFMLTLALPLSATAAPPKLPHARPNEAGMNAAHLEHIDAVVAEGLAAGRMPGCVVLIGRQGKIVFRKAYGDRQSEPERVSMTADTVFDLASLTKPIATATSIMQLVERGRLRLSDRVADHLPEFGQNGKERITVLQLLTHQGGLIPDNALADYADGPDEAMKRIDALTLKAGPGERFLYSDVGFIVLGRLVEKLSGQPLDEYAREHIFRPLGMTETGYLPDEPLRERAAPTERRDGHWMQGEVHDPRAFRLGGVAGHAGLFSTADDLAVYAQMLLDSGTYRGVRVLGPRTVAAMTAPVETPGGLRGLGWDIRTGYSSNRGELMSEQAFGHGGFTGTALWIDPQLDLFVIFLSNRVHPDGRGSVNPLAGRIGTIAAAAIEPETTSPTEADDGWQSFPFPFPPR